MKTRIAYKIGLLASLLVAVAAFIVGFRAYSISTAVLQEHEKVDLTDEMKLRGKEVLEQIAMLREDVLTLTGSPSLQGIVRAGMGDAADPSSEDALSHRSEAQLIQDFEQECRQICRFRVDQPAATTDEALKPIAETGKAKPYLSVRLVRATEGGRELVHIRRTGDTDVAFEPAPLRERDAPGGVLAADSGEAPQPGQPDQGVLLTPVQMSGDEGRREPVLRAMVRLRTPDDGLFGVVMIDLDFRELQKRLVSSRHLTYLTDNQGQFLIHPDPRREFASGPSPATGIQNEPGLSEVSQFYGDLPPEQLREVTNGVPLENMLTAAGGFGERFLMLRLRLKAESKDRIGSVLAPLKDALTALKNEYAGHQNRLVVQDPEYLNSSTTSIVISAPYASATRESDLADAEARLLTAGRPHFEREYRADCRSFHASYIRLPYNPRDSREWLGLAMAFSQEELNADIASATTGVNWLIVSSILIATAFAFLFSHMLTRRLSQVTRAAESIAAGNFHVELPLTSRDEIGELARGFQHMIEEVQSRGSKLEENQARLQGVVEGAAEGIVQLKRDGEVLEANAAALRMFGRSVPDVSGRSFRELLAPNERSRFDDALRRLIKVGGTTTDLSLIAYDPAASSLTPGRREHAPEKSSLESVGLRADGREFPVDISLSLVRLEGEQILTLIARDITNSKRAKLVEQQKEELERTNIELQKAHEQAQELNKAKDGFLASVSHELRNPLNQVSGFCQLLEFSNLDDGQREDIRKIRLANDQLLSLINDILDYQKIIMRGVTLDPEPIAVAGLVQEIRDAMSVQANDNKNQLVFEAAADAGELVADKQRVRQVLLNLVGNACKFTSAGTVRLTATRLRQGDNEWIEFSVADTGCGMTPDELDRLRLFQPFFKAGAKKGNKSGTGLGLVISKGFCEMMRGDIRIESAVGVGTTFTVRLPARATDMVPGQAEPPPQSLPDRESNGARQAAPVPPAAVPAAAAAGEPASAGRLVLVIDDDPTVREMMKRHLANHGFQVATASSGIEGLELAARLHPAVITLDAIMPGLDGWKVLGALKAGEETARIPVMMVTVMDRPEQGFSRGASDFISKPIDWNRLTASLAHYTGDKRDRSLLIVDDDPLTREILRRQLSADGWSILEAENGQEALALLATEQPAAIILDLMMPVMDGFEFIVNYSQLAESASIPVLVLTAKDPTPEERRLLEGQVIRVLHKGAYSDDDLLTEIHRRVDAHLREEPVATDGGEKSDGQDPGR